MSSLCLRLAMRVSFQQAIKKPRRGATELCWVRILLAREPIMHANAVFAQRLSLMMIKDILWTFANDPAILPIVLRNSLRDVFGIPVLCDSRFHKVASGSFRRVDG